MEIPRLGPEELFWDLKARSKTLVFFPSYTRARRTTGLWPYHPKCDWSHKLSRLWPTWIIEQLGPKTGHGIEGCVSFLPLFFIHYSTLGSKHAHSPLWFPLTHLPYGKERVNGMIWASYKFPISVERTGLLAGRGLGWARRVGGWGDLGKSQEVVSR